VSVEKRGLEKQALRLDVSFLQNTRLFVLFPAPLDRGRLCQQAKALARPLFFGDPFSERLSRNPMQATDSHISETNFHPICHFFTASFSYRVLHPDMSISISAE
jgi:hypothetical protein